MDHIDLFEGVGGAAPVDQGGGHVRRPELPAHHPLFHPGKVGVEVLQRPFGVHLANVVLGTRPEHLRQIVMGIDHRHRPMERPSPSQQPS
jgi:hypothetical protein